MAHVAGPFTFSHQDLELRRHGAVVPLQRQPALVLSCLLRNRGRIVSREELARFVWSDGHYVDVDQSLRYCIRQIRVALDDDAGAPRYVENLPRKGYRWIAADLSRRTAAARYDWIHDCRATAAVAMVALAFGFAIGQPRIVRALHVVAHRSAPPSVNIAAELAFDTIHNFLTR